MPESSHPAAGKRQYRSPRRRMQAEQTRASVVAAASRVFEERGWMAANMRDIAGAAEVSVETLYSGFGSKAGLLCAALDVAVVGDDEPVPFAERSEATAMGAGPTVRARARAAAQVATAINERIYRLDQTLRQGAAVEPVLAERLAASEASRRAAVADAAARVARRQVTKAEVDELAALTSSAVYDLLVRSSGWSNSQYKMWLTRQLTELIERKPDDSELE